jgi:hypothetical protein
MRVEVVGERTNQAGVGTGLGTQVGVLLPGVGVRVEAQEGKNLGNSSAV